MVPISGEIKSSILIIIYSFLFIVELRNSIVKANTVWSVIKWLLVAPITISVVAIGYIGIWWQPIQQDRYFILLLMVLFIVSWGFAAYNFDLDKVKAAVLVLNGVLITILTFVFLTTLDAEMSKLIFGPDLIQIANNGGFSSNSLIGLIVKLLTLPFVVSSLWAQVIIELRSVYIIG